MNIMQDLEAHIEAVLFYKGEPMSQKELAKLFDTTPEIIHEAVQNIRNRLNHGIALMEQNGEYALVTNPKSNEVIEKMAKEELSKDLGKAGLETLAIIAYKGPVSRSEIDYIRGVNSSYIVRNLLVRGLIGKVESKGRGTVYSVSMDLLSHLGITRLDELPEFESIQKRMHEAKEEVIEATT